MAGKIDIGRGGASVISTLLLFFVCFFVCLFVYQASPSITPTCTCFSLENLFQSVGFSWSKFPLSSSPYLRRESLANGDMSSVGAGAP